MEQKDLEKDKCYLTLDLSWSTKLVIPNKYIGTFAECLSNCLFMDSDKIRPIDTADLVLRFKSEQRIKEEALEQLIKGQQP